MLMFRSKVRRLSYYDPCVQKNINLCSEKLNFHAWSYCLMILVTCLSNRCGKWAVLGYFLASCIFLLISSFCHIRNYINNQIYNLTAKIQQLLTYTKRIFIRSLSTIGNIQREYVKLNNIATTFNQVIFFIMCGKLLLPHENVTDAFYSLIIYNVLSYFICYLDEVLNNTSWTPYITIAHHSDVKHLAMSATKMVLEVTKLATFIIGFVFIIFSLCLEFRIGPHRYQPTKIFTFLTFYYYLMTEKSFGKFISSFLTYLEIAYLQNLETLWTPVILSTISQCLSLLMTFAILLKGELGLAFVAFYINVYLNYQKLSNGAFKMLNEGKKGVLQFRYAGRSELQNFDDVCAVCLNEMKVARITPCHHIFHTECLRQCLLNSNNCPICKRELSILRS